MKRWIYVVAVVLALAAAAWLVRAGGARGVGALLTRSDRGAPKQTIPTAAVSRGRFTVTLPVSGFLESAEVTPVTSEVDGRIVELCDNNAPVTPGDLVFQLDIKDLNDQRDDLLQTMADRQESLNKTEADGEVEISQAESDVARATEALQMAQTQAQAGRDKATAQVNFAQGQLARGERELSRIQRLAQLNYVAGTKLQAAEKEWRRLQFDLDQRKAEQADVEKRTAEDVQVAQTALDSARQRLDASRTNLGRHVAQARANIVETQRQLDDVNRKIEQCRVVAPAGGLAVMETNYENWPERRPYRVGDSVQAGSSPVRIYNLAKMRVRCQIGEMDISRVRKGQAALVATSGQAGRSYAARVASVEELARESNVWQGGTPGKKVFGVLVTLERSDPARLRPGMTVDLEIVLRDLPDVTSVPIRAVFHDRGQSVVFRQLAAGFERVPVTLGARGDLAVEVSAPGYQPVLRAGDRVALARPAAESVAAAAAASAVGGAEPDLGAPKSGKAARGAGAPEEGG